MGAYDRQVRLAHEYFRGVYVRGVAACGVAVQPAEFLGAVDETLVVLVRCGYRLVLRDAWIPARH